MKMASSQHIMTVCMFCLLCATHSSCSAHDSVLSSDQNLKTVQDLKHEKFKVVELIMDDDVRIQEIPKQASKESSYDASTDVNFNHRDSLSDVGRNLIGFNKDYWIDALHLKHKHSSKKYPLNNWREKHVTSKNKHLLSGSNEESGQDYNHIDVISPMENNSPQDLMYNFIEQSNIIAPAVDQSVFSRLNEEDKHMSRTKRDLPSIELVKNETPPQPVEYKINRNKNIDVDFYVKKLFSLFGNKDTMTMDLEGFDRMLKKLDLDRMVVEAAKIENGVSLQKPPVEGVVNGVRSNSTDVVCTNSVDLISSLNLQRKASHSHDESTARNESHHNVTSTQTLDQLKSGIFINAHILSKVCPILLYQKVSNTSYEREGCLEEKEFPKLNNVDDEHDFHDHLDFIQGSSNRTTVWIYSSLSILVISLCGLLGVVVIPIMHHEYYNQILQFLVALAVGTLSGDALLHLLPHALSPDAHDHSHNHSNAEHTHAHNDSMWKGLTAMIGVVFFYFTEKILNLITEWRKKKLRKDKENKLPSRVRVMRNDIGCLKGSGSCSSHSGKDGFLKIPGLSALKTRSENKDVEQNNVQSSGKICKHKYSDYPYCYDEITTDTLDDLHHRNMSKNSSNEKVVNKMKIANEESPLSLVSLNILNEPEANEALLSHTNDIKSNNTVLSNNSVQKNAIGMGFEMENMIRNKETSNGGKRTSAVNMLDGHERSRSVDRAAEAENTDHDEKGYTVILREHSQNHHGHSHSHGHVHSPPSSLSSVVWMVIMGDGLHNFTDGMAIGAAFSSNIAGGFSTAIAVLCHELPHEIGDFAVLLKAGMSAKRAVCYNLLSSILCLFGMMVGVYVGHTPEASAWIFAAAAGMFLYIALVDMIPELSSSHSNEGSLCQCLLQLSGLTCGIGIMLVIAMYEDHLKSLFG